MSSAQENMACVLRYTTWNDQQSKRVHTFNPVRRTDGLRMPFASCYLPQELRWPELVSMWRRGSYMAVFSVKELHMDRKLYMVAIAGQKYMQSWESQADICAWRESSACCMKPSFMCWLTSAGQPILQHVSSISQPPFPVASSTANPHPQNYPHNPLDQPLIALLLRQNGLTPSHYFRPFNSLFLWHKTLISVGKK